MAYSQKIRFAHPKKPSKKTRALAKAAAKAAKVTFPFLELPPELRDTIYRLLLVNRSDKNHHFGHARILSTCQQIHEEAVGILYEENLIEISISMCGIYVFNIPMTIFRFPLSKIRKLEIFLNPVYNSHDRNDTDARKVIAYANFLAHALAAEPHSLQKLTLRIGWRELYTDTNYSNLSAEWLMLSAFADKLRNVPVVRIVSVVTEYTKARMIAEMRGSDQPVKY